MFMVVSKNTGQPIIEVSNTNLAKAWNNAGFEVIESQEWIARYDRLIKEAGGLDPSPEAMRASIGSK